MGKIRPPLPVKLFVGMLSPEHELFDACAQILQREFGPIDSGSECMPWDSSDYYRGEMGPNIFRKFLFFEQIADPGRLSQIKRFTNDLENNYAVNAVEGLRRRINLDPGYVTEAKVVLASTKDFAHRLYIGDGIYAEVTLRYSVKDRSFVPHEHTYPDYRTAPYLALFNSVREDLRTRLRTTRPP
jgi:uncharacterized protein DUF4416